MKFTNNSGPIPAPFQLFFKIVDSAYQSHKFKIRISMEGQMKLGL